MRHSPFDRTEARIRLLKGSNCYFFGSYESKRKSSSARRKERERGVGVGGGQREKEEAGGKQMEVSESRNKRYVNPRNGAVYSSHKKANKIFFRSGRSTPEPSSVLIPRFRSLPLNSFLPPEK